MGWHAWFISDTSSWSFEEPSLVSRLLNLYFIPISSGQTNESKLNSFSFSLISPSVVTSLAPWTVTLKCCACYVAGSSVFWALCKSGSVGIESYFLNLHDNKYETRQRSIAISTTFLYHSWPLMLAFSWKLKKYSSLDFIYSLAI